MSSTLALASAVRLLVPADLTLFDDQVKPNEAGAYGESLLPWVVLRTQFPDTRSTSLAGTRLGQRVRVRTTVAGLTVASVQVIVDKLDAALEGARPTAAGWALTPIRRITTTDLTEDRDVTLIDSNRHPLFVVVEWEFTATETS